jgi:asparagine synthase (glutamine-hydrolysing)
LRGFCGWFSSASAADGAATLRGMLAASHAPTPEVEMKTAALAGLAAFGGVARPSMVEADGLLLLLAGHPKWRRDGEPGTDDHLAIARAIRARGRAALADIGGDFALAAWDSERRRGLLAVDRIGMQPLVYTHCGEALAFASTLDLLGGYPGVRRELSSQAIYDYLFYHVCPGPQTIFNGSYRVPAGHCIEFGAGASAQPVAYWTPRYTEPASADLPRLEAEFIEHLRVAVRECASGARAGSFLSGGTDSSTVSGTLSQVFDTPARTFSIGFDAAGFDETGYARIAAKHFKTEHHEYYVTPKDVVDALPAIAASYDQPFGNASAIPTYYCAKLARDNGVERLLAGDGGDELFGGNERYAKQHLLSLYGRVPGPLKSALIEPLLLSAPGIGRLPLLRKLRSYVEQARPPMPQRYESYNLLQHLGAANVLTPDFLAGIDTEHPRQLMAQAFAPLAQDRLVNQMMGIDLRFILADGDLPKVGHMCNLADIDVAFPLLDDRLVDFAAQLPADLQLRGTQLRWFFKHALRNFLPPEIITKQKHGFGLPVGDWLMGHKPLRDLAVDSIDLLRPRGIVRAQFIDELLNRKLPEQPGYYGVMVWVLMMLGLWTQSRKL